ncbi:tetratricopeptide repeat protein, partial [Helicobacter acinonychis]|uniref:tetratricopeptide repeat protein n=1 Tax=Helicobacter acinonychis TaxID=212 RepID=UPI00349F6586
MISSWTKKWVFILFLMASCLGHLMAQTGETYLKKANQALKMGYHQKAVAFYKRSCNLRVGVSCTSLGSMYEDGEGVDQNVTKAVFYYKRGCNLRDRLACASLGSMYEDGEGVQKDLSKALYYYKRGCHLKEGVSCGSLGFMYFKGVGVTQDDV